MSHEKLLIVDDDAVSRRMLRELVEREGYATVEAKNGKEALEAVSRYRPDLILLDLVMPEMDGYGFCRSIKQDPDKRLIPILVVTALDWLPAKLLALEHLASDFLNKPVNELELAARVRSHLALKRFTDELENAGTVLEGIARVVEQRDAYTSGHANRVAHGAAKLGKLLEMEDADLDALILGARFHDLGKIAVADSILRKEGPLSPEEMELMRTHPAVGEDLLRPMKTMEKVLPLVRSHHERLDGSGYPDGLSGSKIPVPVRILSVVDIYDALTTSRTYRRALRPEEALNILRTEAEKGWWDAKIVQVWAATIAGKVTPAHAVQ